MVSIRKCLHISMVSDGDRLVSPFHRTFNDVFDIGDSVHIAHFSMAVQLDSLFRACIHSCGRKISCLFDADNGTDG